MLPFSLRELVFLLAFSGAIITVALRLASELMLAPVTTVSAALIAALLCASTVLLALSV